MRVSYQHANVRSGNESTLLRFTAADGTRACVLVDAGANVDVASMLSDEEYLNAVVLTHAHIDHYRTLPANVLHSAPVYATPDSATILERAMPEATKDNDLGDVSAALDALEPIDDWTTILPNLDVRPIPAGHTPGAGGFLFRFDDESREDELLGGRQYLLVSGDFTVRPCAGYPGFTTDVPVDVDALFLSASTESGYEAALNESVRTVLERAYAGSRVVVAAGSLTGVHYGALLGTLAERLDRSIPITVVGQAAKLADGLGYDVPGVTTTPVFDRPDEVLHDGGVTIVGPESPTTGSAARLLGAIEDDPAALFAQLTTGGAGTVTGVRCTTRSFTLRNHPSIETIDDVVDGLAPKQVVIKHAMGNTLNELQRRFDRCFTWGTNDGDIHRLYEDGEWVVPGWITEETATRIRRRQLEARRDRTLSPDATIPPLGRDAVDLVAEGVDVDGLAATFDRTATDPYETESASVESSVDGATKPRDETAESRDGTAEPRSGPSTGGETSGPDEEIGDDGTDEKRADALRSAADDRRGTDDLLARLDAIEAKLERSERAIPARVLDGEHVQLLELLDEIDVEAGTRIEVIVRTAAGDGTSDERD